MSRNTGFTVQLTQYENGAIVFPPPYPLKGEFSISMPDVMAESKTQLFPLGTLAWFPGIGKKYRYAKSGEAAQNLEGKKILVVNGNFVPDSAGYFNDGGFYGVCKEDDVASAYDVGATEIYVTGTQDTAKDFYAGGHMIHFDAGRATVYEESYVIAGPDEVSTGTWHNQKITLAEPKKYAILASDGIEIWCNPYSNILRGHVAPTDYKSFETHMGVPMLPIQPGYYFWLQTAGLLFITPDGWGANTPGYTADSREAAAGDGAGNMSCTLVEGAGRQRLGTVLAVTPGTDADALINLDLDIGH